MSAGAFPMVSVEDLPAVRRFYELLGFEQTYQFPADGEPVFVIMERDGSRIGIGVDDATTEDRFGYWVYVEDVDGAVETLAAAGATVVEQPEDQEWGERVASVRDPAGNLVVLGASRR